RGARPHRRHAGDTAYPRPPNGAKTRNPNQIRPGHAPHETLRLGPHGHPRTYAAAAMTRAVSTLTAAYVNIASSGLTISANTIVASAATPTSRPYFVSLTAVAMLLPLIPL